MSIPIFFLINITYRQQLSTMSEQFHDKNLRRVIGSVLTWSQRYMRRSEVSFVNVLLIAL